MSVLPYIAHETLKNGIAVTIRAARPDDRRDVATAVRALSPESIYLRLFSNRRELTEPGLDRIMRSDGANELLLLAVIESPEDHTIVGAGRYVRVRPDAAEIAFIVADDHHGQGIASLILRHLAIVARGQGIATFEADTLSENTAMRAVFSKTGWPMQSKREGEIVHTTLTISGIDRNRSSEQR